MGLVYKARHRRLHRRVALKIIKPRRRMIRSSVHRVEANRRNRDFALKTNA
jgi:hypothetical protein